jgi:hypothetical protein
LSPKKSTAELCALLKWEDNVLKEVYPNLNKKEVIKSNFADKKAQQKK